MTDRLAHRSQIVEIVAALRRLGIEGFAVSEYCAEVRGRPVTPRPSLTVSEAAIVLERLRGVTQ
jgi:hypothetical protein